MKKNQLNKDTLTEAEQLIQSISDAIDVKMSDHINKQIKAHAYRKGQEIKHKKVLDQLKNTGGVGELFYAMAAADNDDLKDRPIERISKGREFITKILPQQNNKNQVLIILKILADNSADYEGRKAIIKIGDQIVLSELIEDGIAEIILDKSKTPIDLTQPIMSYIE